MTRPRHLQVTSIPPGEAPAWVRQEWVGLALPLAQRSATPGRFLTSGVLTGPRSLRAFLAALLTGGFAWQTGFAVDARAAIAVLEARSPQAASWWRAHAPQALRAGRIFVFQADCGHVA